MNKILTITNKASAELKKIIDSAPPETIGVIVGVDKSGCSGYSYKLSFAKQNEVDNLECINLNDVNVYIENKATMFLIGSEMDYFADKLSSRFVFNNPNQKSTCGCGESFSV